MEKYAARGDASITIRPEFWAEVQELIDMFACSWRRTTLTIAYALWTHARALDVILETPYGKDVSQ